MSLKRLFNADSALSVLLHALKALVALFVNWLVLSQFPVEDFVLWSVTLSVLIVATASDLGIGQYAVMRMINSPQSEWPEHVRRCTTALVPMVILSGLIVVFAIEGPSLLYRVLMALLLVIRLITVPFWSVLNAANQFKIRKAIDLAAYLVAALLVWAITEWVGDIYLALVALNTTFLLGAIATTLFAARYVSLRRSLRLTQARAALEVFRAAVPFTSNTLVGLLTYGGFMWLSSLVLPTGEVAKLAVLHTFVLMNLYQFYDVFLRARQADLADVERLPSYRRLNVLLMLAVPAGFVAVGREALALIGNPVEISLMECALFALFMAAELGNLFAQSITQVNLALVNRLKVYSSMRAAMLVGFLLAGLLPIEDEQKFLVLLGSLLAGSMITFGYLIRDGRSIPASSPRPAPAGDGSIHRTGWPDE